MRIGFFSVFVMSVALYATPSVGHHSFAPHYDPDTIITFTGELTELVYRNPHSSVKVEVINDSGGTDVWTCEMNAAGYLQREGITRESFTVGEQITITGAVARRRATGCRVYVATTADGNRIQLFGGAPPEDVIEGFESASNSMFGVWLIDARSSTLGPERIRNNDLGPNPFGHLLTAAGRAASDSYEQTTDDPALRCSPASPWRAWWDPQGAISIERAEDMVVIRFEYMDGLREVHLDQNSHPENVARSTLGYSIGTLEGNTLFMDTVGFSSGVLIPHPGVLMSPDARMYEELSFDPATHQLRVHWRLEDPEYYSGALTGDFAFAPADVEVTPYNCVPSIR